MFKQILPNVLSMLAVTAIIGGLTLWMQFNILQDHQQRTEIELKEVNSKMDCWYSEQIYLSNMHYLHMHDSKGVAEHPKLQRSLTDCISNHLNKDN